LKISLATFLPSSSWEEGEGGRTYLSGGSRPICQGAIYLAKKIIRYDILQNKGKCFYFNIPISNYDFWGNHLKIPHFTHIAKENWKEDCNSNNTLQFSL
jgi:hypothetical protein